MVAEAVAMSPEELRAYMEKYSFDVDFLAEALGVHRVSVVKWRSGVHPIRNVTKLALEHLAEDTRALRKRKRALELQANAKQQTNEQIEAARALVRADV